ncbi:MAG: hypothetical protein SFU56_03135 [Capsulimonadales bacterium]|nr:hypothetical protein [Capsulimonadales bacterium]
MKLYFAIPAVALLALNGFLLRAALPEMLRQPDTEGAEEVYEEKPTTSILGEFRTSLASYLYGRAHEYMHGGVVFRAATESEVQKGKRVAAHGDSLEDHHGSQETSVVPESEYDPRSFWGDIERGAQPWMDIRRHGHRDLAEALPLFRMMTWTDPHFVEGYDMGSYLVFCAAKDRNVDRALEFLAEGIANNPGSFRLQKSYGHYLLANKGQPEEALVHLRKAVEILERRAAKGGGTDRTQRQQLIDDIEVSQTWNEFIMALRKTNRREEAIRWSRRCIEINAPCASGVRTLKIYGLPLPKTRSL